MLSKDEAREKRRRRIRRKVVGAPQRPRLAVFRSARHIYAQVIDDSAGRTLAHASSCEADLRGARAGMRKREMAVAVGKRIAQRCLERGISAVVFDRGGYRYHGRVAAVAGAAREAGLNF